MRLFWLRGYVSVRYIDCFATIHMTAHSLSLFPSPTLSVSMWVLSVGKLNHVRSLSLWAVHFSINIFNLQWFQLSSFSPLHLWRFSCILYTTLSVKSLNIILNLQRIISTIHSELIECFHIFFCENFVSCSQNGNIISMKNHISLHSSFVLLDNTAKKPCFVWKQSDVSKLLKGSVCTRVCVWVWSCRCRSRHHSEYKCFKIVFNELLSLSCTLSSYLLELFRKLTATAHTRWA